MMTAPVPHPHTLCLTQDNFQLTEHLHLRREWIRRNSSSLQLITFDVYASQIYKIREPVTVMGSHFSCKWRFTQLGFLHPAHRSVYRDKWSLQHCAFSDSGLRHCIQIWTVAASLLKKRSLTADKTWSSIL